jgi:hypothetical protein
MRALTKAFSEKNPNIEQLGGKFPDLFLLLSRIYARR